MMIAFLDGILEEKEPTRVVINVHGVGYEAAIPLSSYDRLPAPGQPVRLLTVPVIREDAHLLFGFMSTAERDTFLQLTSVNGIGPKLGLAVLSGLAVRDIKAAIANNDIKRLSSISGIGKKTAERIVLEMRDKLGKGEMMAALAGGEADSPTNAKLRDVLLALLSLGHKQADAQRMVKDIAGEITPEMPLEDILRKVLSGRHGR
ncbi:MAG TPA: Holliday junction branch migration protein RuvA [Kiritimatiellia bacterium]|jgi:Holliday junction DNA helicase RuvA|nr:MAG: Holliday junction ATP-dependent DNA helicase RuvA [Verrucomicrobia bacterium ADurb.Bin018]HOD99641.1 Holliday junction branch migration protein RuvA [Kiritimatiellia bacterium]HOR74361.1 Holliday junction branch migration protein RuvA [Kiritimatiellia bacterium]HOU58569.1 Holliday junction branch migration protein RuvA [Kiritimatiellia bacterium]HPK68833.1 Holliday junction branch migration protein RuvA [Kiritimatiellia bacterium]